jgi:nucleosome binding factor SPN SPT16 subunit
MDIRRIGREQKIKYDTIFRWILYNQPDFVANSKKDVGILSGENACGNFKDVS